MIKKIKIDLRRVSSKERARINVSFFKTGKGEYGEGDKFIGVSVPDVRKIAKEYFEVPLTIVEKLLQSPIHEERLCALLILVHKYQKGDKLIVNFYLKNLRHVNNWDLVDLSADKILGDYLLDKSRKKLYSFAKSDHLWIRRISIISTFAFIKKNDFKDTLKISHLLLKDSHDLIHKAVGWMLREVGKRKEEVLISFLDSHHKHMPRTALRYSIERLSYSLKKHYMRR